MTWWIIVAAGGHTVSFVFIWSGDSPLQVIFLNTDLLSFCRHYIIHSVMVRVTPFQSLKFEHNIIQHSILYGNANTFLKFWPPSKKTIHLVPLKSKALSQIWLLQCAVPLTTDTGNKNNFINYMATLTMLLRSEDSAAKYNCCCLQKMWVIYIDLLL